MVFLIFATNWNELKINIKAVIITTDCVILTSSDKFIKQTWDKGSYCFACLKLLQINSIKWIWDDCKLFNVSLSFSVDTDWKLTKTLLFTQSSIRSKLHKRHYTLINSTKTLRVLLILHQLNATMAIIVLFCCAVCSWSNNWVCCWTFNSSFFNPCFACFLKYVTV